MKKCVRCQIIFHNDHRLYCLYCDSSLQAASTDEIFQLGAGTKAIEKVMKSKELMTPERLQHLAGSYFKTKSISFFYGFCRNQLKMGRDFKRFLVQPIDFSFVIKIPWVFVDLADSVAFRLMYTGYCDKCQWKYKRFTERDVHSEDDCLYNREYTTILNDILNGEIVRNEAQFEQSSQERIQQGKRSAYRDLCSRKKDFETFTDIVGALISISIIIYILARLTMPMFGAIYDF